MALGWQEIFRDDLPLSEDFARVFTTPRHRVDFNDDPLPSGIGGLINATLDDLDLNPTHAEYSQLYQAVISRDGYTYADLINGLKEKKNMPFNLGNFLTNAAGIATGQGILVGPQGPIARPAPVTPSVVPTYQMAGMGQGTFENAVRGSNLPGTGGFYASDAMGGQGADTPSTDFFDFGAPGIPTGGTAAQRRSFLLRIASQNVGSRVSARDVVQMAHKIGLQKTQQILGLEEQAVCFILVNVPKRRRRGITARDISRTRAFASRLATANAAVRSIKGPSATRRRAPATRSSTITTVK
jgi:hypothetical protein